MSTPLPSFLEQTGPASFTLTLSASAAESFMLCPAKYSWSRVTGIEGAAPRAGMNYGKAMHLLLGALYREALDCSVIAPEDILTEHFAANPQPELNGKGRPEWRTAARALQAFGAYRAKYPAEDFAVLGVEEPFEVELGSFAWRPAVPTLGGEIPGEPISVIVRFRGIRDLRVKWHDALWVLDHKTSTEWSDLTIEEGKASFQFQGYAWVERLLAQQTATAPNPQSRPIPDRVGGVIGNYLIARENYSNPDRKPTARDLPRDQFERHAFAFSDAELDEWHADAMELAAEIFAKWQAESWPRRRTACAHWGKCEYYALCWETDPAYRLSAALGADYRKRTPSPLDEAE